MSTAEYEVVVRAQADADTILRHLGALQQIEHAILAHCAATRPAPPYKPQEYKRLLAEHGWMGEARVPPYDAAWDKLAINERYDALKFFRRDDGVEVGVAIEMEGWEIYNDLLKFRRGHQREQIVAGVILQPDYATLRYCFEHMRHVNEPLVGHIPIAWVCPRGPGLPEPKESKTRLFTPYRMPAEGSYGVATTRDSEDS